MICHSHLCFQGSLASTSLCFCYKNDMTLFRGLIWFVLDLRLRLNQIKLVILVAGYRSGTVSHGHAVVFWGCVYRVHGSFCFAVQLLAQAIIRPPFKECFFQLPLIICPTVWTNLSLFASHCFFTSRDHVFAPKWHKVYQQFWLVHPTVQDRNRMCMCRKGLLVLHKTRDFSKSHLSWKKSLKHVICCAVC